MNEGGGKQRSDDEGDDLLWNDFENCAQSVTILYRNPSWKAMQTAAASTTQLYKSGLEHKKKAYDRGHIAGKQTLAREIYALRRYREISVDDVWRLLSKIVCATDHGYSSRSPTPEQSDGQAVSLFQQALCIPPNVTSPQRATELNTFLSCQVHRRRKRRHSPTEFPYRKVFRS